MFEKLKSRALKNEAYVIYLAARDAHPPWYAKALIFFVVAHTFIPIFGYLDDIITPLGIALAGNSAHPS